ncbi:MAG: aminotransferase class V-fold PLP-dependent enzyme [Gammaproteobacteria bacterium]
MHQAALQTSRPAAGFDPETVHADFPMLAERSGEPALHYLDNAASAQKPAAVIEAVSDCYRCFYAPVHRGLYRLAEQATAAYELARARVAFRGRGCAICIASASMMTEVPTGRRRGDAEKLSASFRDWFDSAGNAPAPPEPLPALTAVRGYPARRRCVLLAWEALNAILAEGSGSGGVPASAGRATTE